MPLRGLFSMRCHQDTPRALAPSMTVKNREIWVVGSFPLSAADARAASGQRRRGSRGREFGRRRVRTYLVAVQRTARARGRSGAALGSSACARSRGARASARSAHQERASDRRVADISGSQTRAISGASNPPGDRPREGAATPFTSPSSSLLETTETDVMMMAKHGRRVCLAKTARPPGRARTRRECRGHIPQRHGRVLPRSKELATPIITLGRAFGRRCHRRPITHTR